MRLLVAPDSFKGSLTSQQAAGIISKTLTQSVPDTEIIQCPLADGGEGTLSVLSSFIPDDVCVIESAKLIGLNLPEMVSLDVMNRGSTSLGDAILKGLDAGKRDFVIGLGGSATNDGGLGMLIALGMQAFDKHNLQVEPNLSGLLALVRVDISNLDSRLTESRLTILSDVESPLHGENGATAFYGPQKGLQRGDVERVDQAMSKFAELCGDTLGSYPATDEGAGAAGGLGFALMLLDGEMVSGAEFVIETTGFKNALTHADWVITGEGCSDAQTLQGKLPIKVAEAAKEAGAKVALLSGSIEQASIPELEKWFDLLVPTKPEAMSVEQAMEQAEGLLTSGVQQIIERISHDN